MLVIFLLTLYDISTDCRTREVITVRVMEKNLQVCLFFYGDMTDMTQDVD